MSTIVAFPDEARLNYNVALLDGLAISFLVLTTVTLALRVWVRTKLISCWGKDDWTVLLAQACFITTCGLILNWAEYQRDPVPSQSFHSVAQSYDDLLIQGETYLATMILLKISLAAFFLRFLVERWARLIIWISTIIFTVWTFALFFVLLFYCGTPTHILEKAMQGKCISGSTIFTLGIVWGSFNALTDWILALLPICFVLKSRMSNAAKISVVVIMVIAVVGSGAAIARLVYYKKLETVSNYWDTASQFLAWSIVEPGIGIFTGNLATLRPLLGKTSPQPSSAFPSSAFASTSNGRTGDCTKHALEHVDRKPSSNSDHTTVVANSDAWESELNFVTAINLDDQIDKVEKGHL